MMIGSAQVLALLLLATPEGGSFAILKALDGADLVPEGIEAQAIGLPPASDAAEFAGQVVEAEHLTSWNNGPMTEAEAIGSLSYKSLNAADGRTVIVYYSRDPSGPRAVCRLRVKQPNGLSDARFRALRWCALQVGVLLPDQPAAPVETRRPR
ncbi:MAG: hypothetical protein ACREE0_20235 [Phenylobacterium sp.]